MAEEIDLSCARPTGGPVGETVKTEGTEKQTKTLKEDVSMIKVGKDKRMDN